MAGMTVTELIAELQKMPASSVVVLRMECLDCGSFYFVPAGEVSDMGRGEVLIDRDAN